MLKIKIRRFSLETKRPKKNRDIILINCIIKVCNKKTLKKVKSRKTIDPNKISIELWRYKMGV